MTDDLWGMTDDGLRQGASAIPRWMVKAQWTLKRGTGTETFASQSLRYGLRSQSPF